MDPTSDTPWNITWQLGLPFGLGRKFLLFYLDFRHLSTLNSQQKLFKGTWTNNVSFLWSKHYYFCAIFCDSAIATKHIPVVSGEKDLVIHFAVTALSVLEQQCAVVEGRQLREAEVIVFHKTLERRIWTKSRQVRASTTGHYVTGGIQS